jgi:cell division protease FtsH
VKNPIKPKAWPLFKLFIQRHWLWVAITVGVIVSIIIPIWYMSGMEESVRRYIIGINVASMPWGILQTLVFVAFLYLLQYGGGFSRFKKSGIDSDAVNVRFSDVIGLTEAKREAWEMVQLIKDRAALQRVGGKILHGMLMIGPPGCGKTMLAKAIATEAGVPFLSTAGSEFVEIFVGVGASRVRKLFKQARQYAEAYGACIIFIDELEVLGKSRTFFDAFGGSSESNSTLNQLLVEMDGLADVDANIVVIGAMNAPEQVLDDALLRPGRFDRTISISRPNLAERKEIFEYYAKKLPLDPSVDLARLARKAVYKSPAEIENILKEAALISVRNKRDTITYKDVSAAIERIELGVAHRLNMTKREREMTAYHEAGHLLMVYLTHPTNDVFKASIISRGGTLGVVHSIPREELFSQDVDMLKAQLRVSLAGYAAEKFKFGVTTTGVSSDFSTAMSVAHSMVWNYGMGGNGFIGNFSAIPAGGHIANQLSEALKEKLNMETQALLHTAIKEVEDLLKVESHILDRFAMELLAKDELDYDEIVAIFKEYGKPPKEIPEIESTNGSGSAVPAPAALDGLVLTSLEGEPIDLGYFKGKLLLLDFWTTWCPPCQKSSKFLSELHKKYSNQGLVILGINQGEGKIGVEAFVKEHGPNYPMILDTHGVAKRTFLIKKYPDFRLIAPSGEVLWHHEGFIDSDPEKFEIAIAKALQSLTPPSTEKS